MICEVLFPEFCNLYGDSANMRYLEACAPSLTFVYTHNRETPRFASEPVSMLYLGSMPESRQEVAVERLRPYTEQLRRAIEAGTVVLATGNACELFGQYIAEGGRRIPMLGLYDFHAERDRGARHNSMFIGRFEADGTSMDIVGNRSQFSTLHGPAIIRNCPPPIFVFGPISTTVSSGWNLRLTALNGSDTRVTLSTISKLRSISISMLSVLPIRPSTV